MQLAADWVADRLRALDFDRVEMLPTAGNPVVYGEWFSPDSNAPTIMIYGHYDVAPVEPLDEWDSDPFAPFLKGDNLYGRGSSDMKGQIMACVAAVEAIKHVAEGPLNIKFLIEGEEEIVSPSLPAFLEEHQDMLTSDFCLNTDAGMVGPESPSITYALRGGMGCRLHVVGPSRDLHSGLYGGVVHNPIHVLSELIAGFHNEDGRVAIPGFYDKVREIDEAQRLMLAKVPYPEEKFLMETGAPFLWGEAGYSPLERMTVRPTLEVVCFEGGSLKNAIPSKARAAIGMRLVPDQDPKEIYEQTSNYVRESLPETVTWNLEFRGGIPAVLVDLNSPWVDALSMALEAVWEVKPVLIRSGGGIPAVTYFKEKLGIDSVLTGFGLPDDNLHGPNEKLHIPTWKRGVDALIHFFYNLAELQNQ
jgi:acetylornithine deacetylase/succinyl-diaminopimelate desuccinylase-like protein